MDDINDDESDDEEEGAKEENKVVRVGEGDMAIEVDTSNIDKHVTSIWN